MTSGPYAESVACGSATEACPAANKHTCVFTAAKYVSLQFAVAVNAVSDLYRNTCSVGHIVVAFGTAQP